MNKVDKQHIEVQPRTLRENIDLIRSNIFPILVITLSSLAFSFIYAWNAVSIFKSTVLIKITKPAGNILDSPLMPSFTDFQFDRFLNNEIEVMKSNQVRKRVAEALIDSFNATNSKQDFYLMLDKKSKNLKEGVPQVAKIDDLITTLKDVDIEAKRGIDFVEIAVQSPKKVEAALIANCYANAYKTTNLEYNRNQLSLVREFLTEQRQEKLKQLNQSEEFLKGFQEKGGIVALDQQASSLIQQLSTLESQRDIQKIEMMSSEKVLQKFKEELKSKAPHINSFLDNVASEEYMKTLQQQLAELKLNREMYSVNKTNTLSGSEALREYDRKIKAVEDILKQKIEVLKTSIFATTPEELRDLAQKILAEEMKTQSLKISVDQLNGLIKNYEQKFNLLPKSSIEFARLQRNREAIEKLFLLVEEKYQESLINEQSQPGNVIIVDKAMVAIKPFKPNRFLIIGVGLVLGLVIAFGYVFLRNFFDNTIKTPDDIQKLNTNVLSWIPQIE
ncbi:MAG: hypothetical protein HYV28_00585, partial [Ignavibacteriales bacterium]|nr:hypothetical protein [Ignavibacteriales bacterium]